MRFFVSAAGDRVQASPLVDPYSPCGGSSWEFSYRCSGGRGLAGDCNDFPISNGHWESHYTSSGATVDVVADCASSSCQGTLRFNLPFQCDTGIVNWTATARGRTAALAQSANPEGLSGNVEVQNQQNGAYHVFRRER